MKSVISYEHDPRTVLLHGSDRGAELSSAPLGLVGHLRAAMEAWHEERHAMKAHDAGSSSNERTMRDISNLTVAELHDCRRDHTGEFAQTGDVLSGLVLNWPSPPGKPS